MKSKTFFSIILICAIFLPLFFVLAAYEQTIPPITGGGTAPTGGGTAPKGGGTAPKGGGTAPKGGGTAPSDGGTVPSDGGTVPSDGGQTPRSGSSFFSFGGISLAQFLYNLELYIWIIFTTLAILMFVFAGFLFLVAQGQPEKLKTARSAFLWGVVGAVIAILAYTIRAIIGGIFNF